jgi:hypothetical protein
MHIPDPRQSSLYQYYIKVVPTIYQHLDTSVVNTNQFSVTEYYKELGTDGNHGLPGMSRQAGREREHVCLLYDTPVELFD